MFAVSVVGGRRIIMISMNNSVFTAVDLLKTEDFLLILNIEKFNFSFQEKINLYSSIPLILHKRGARIASKQLLVPHALVMQYSSFCNPNFNNIRKENCQIYKLCSK